MIRNDDNKGKSLKAIKEKERLEKEQKLRDQCEKYAYERFGEDEVKKLSNKHQGLFYLPILSDHDDNEIEKFAILKPIDRHILSYASTKIEDEGMYTFLEAVLNECWVDGDREIIDDDNYFIPAAQKINKLLEGKKAAMVKR